jgi:PAS domain S-box-containing protein
MSQKESKDILKNIFSISSDGIACSDLTGNILFANKSFTELLGYSADEIKKINIHQLLIGEKSFNKLIMNNESGDKFYDKKFVKRTGEVNTFPVKFWRQQNGLSDGTIWLIIKDYEF